MVLLRLRLHCSSSRLQDADSCSDNQCCIASRRLGRRALLRRGGGGGGPGPHRAKHRRSVRVPNPHPPRPPTGRCPLVHLHNVPADVIEGREEVAHHHEDPQGVAFLSGRVTVEELGRLPDAGEGAVLLGLHPGDLSLGLLQELTDGGAEPLALAAVF
jgi:hypothetical protein|uniref:Uncharacterized protein n=1 Tax=Zea mays TaxID=4577 RepID=C4J070_MAIZE|nr:unknown [Zea mays]